jgi:P-type Ca2+ transporter type 2C
VLAVCVEANPDGPTTRLDDVGRQQVQATAEAMAARGMRVLGLAERRLGPDDPLPDDPADIESHMAFIGLIGLEDPPRTEVPGAVAALKAASVRVLMLTGDHPATARAIAERVGIDAGRVLRGREIEGLSERQLAEVVTATSVFARITPEHKLRLVEALQRLGDVVAVTGDGVNDGPALRQAAVGIAMGRTGTDVAREAADLVLADDNFATIVEAVREGRAIFSNIKKSIFFLLSSNAGLCITVFVTAFFRDMPSLSALQILWINLVTNGLPALALGVDPPEADQMSDPPRAPDEPFLSRRDWLGILGVGVLMAASAVAVYRLPLWHGVSAGEAHVSKTTIVFTVLALSPLFHAFNCRSERTSVFKLGLLSNRFLVVAVLLSAAVHLLALVVPPLKPVFHSDHVWTAGEVLTVLGLSALPIPAVELVKLVLASVTGPPRRGRARSVAAMPP